MVGRTKWRRIPWREERRKELSASIINTNAFALSSEYLSSIEPRHILTKENKGDLTLLSSTNPILIACQSTSTSPTHPRHTAHPHLSIHPSTQTRTDETQRNNGGWQVYPPLTSTAVKLNRVVVVVVILNNLAVSYLTLVCFISPLSSHRFSPALAIEHLFLFFLSSWILLVDIHMPSSRSSSPLLSPYIE